MQTYGDTAILTYNFAGLQARGRRQGHAVAGQVDARLCPKQGGQWKLVHANFAPVALGALSRDRTGPRRSRRDPVSLEANDFTGRPVRLTRDDNGAYHLDIDAAADAKL